MTDSSSVTPYKPPSHLLGHWTAAELTLHFQEFRDSLENGPELAFERLAGSLREPLNNTARQQRAALDEWRKEKKALQESVDQLRLDLAELNTRLPRDIVGVDRADKVQGSSDPTMQRLVFKLNVTEKGVGATGTLTSSDLPGKPGGFTWADIGPCDSGFQSGYETVDRTPSGVLTGTQRNITFTEEFDSAPNVVVWLTNVDFQGHLSVGVWAADTDTKGFTLRIDTKPDIIIQSLGVAWVAYPSSRYSDFSGSANTISAKDWKCPQFSMSGSMPLYPGFGHDTRRFCAVNALELGEGKDLTLRVDTGITHRTIMEPHIMWQIEAEPPEACLYSVGISFIVLK
ncbi:hypothetical protein Q9L58_009021 [Maublancomyces gigas]|uniref:H-type lectin domain-containing protein n=1 Tax=Discina gigas TaxID=1032678 RepID=A0ABR3G820_9PEZI